MTTTGKGTRPHVDFGRPTVLLRSRRPRAGGPAISLLLDVRTLMVSNPLALAGLTVGLLALATGDYALSVPQVIQAFAGDADALTRTIVMDWRLPSGAVRAAVRGGFGHERRHLPA